MKDERVQQVQVEVGGSVKKGEPCLDRIREVSPQKVVEDSMDFVLLRFRINGRIPVLCLFRVSLLGHSISL